MRFDGRVWFTFSNPQVWEFYRFVRALAEAGNTVNLEWLPLYRDVEADAMSVFVSLPSPQDRGRFLHAMLGLVHLEHLDAEESSTVERAIVAAGLESVDRAGIEALTDIAEAASGMGVSDTPTIYSGGPVMHVVLNGAASVGDVRATAESILSVLNSDGIWTLAKP